MSESGHSEIEDFTDEEPVMRLSRSPYISPPTGSLKKFSSLLRMFRKRPRDSENLSATAKRNKATPHTHFL